MAEIKKYIPKSKSEILSELKKVDRFNLLEFIPKDSRPDGNDLFVSNFEEINKFIDENKRLPSDKGNGLMEFKLFQRLFEIQLDDNKMKILLPFDRHDLFKNIYNESTLETVMCSDQEYKESKLGLVDKFNLLRSPGNSIFDLKHVKKSEQKITTMPEEVAKRKKCLDFNKFDSLFKQCQKEIDSGDRLVVPFRNEYDVKLGAFFIYSGVKCFVAEIGQQEIKNSRNNARLRLIFENGLESNMYQRSLTAQLYKDGRRILPPRTNEKNQEILDDELTGYLYVLSSKSSNSEISAIPNLHKIGFSTTPVLDRIKNAKKDPTYLMADVKIVLSYKVAGIKPVYFENLIHRLFDHVQVELEIVNSQGIITKPKEWYSVPFDIIDDALKLIETGDIINYVYDSKNLILVKKE